MTLRVDGASSLAAGAARIEITPPLEAGLLMSSVEARWAPFAAVRRPLFARALVLQDLSPGAHQDSRQPVAIVSLDLLALSGKALGGFEAFKSRIVEAAGGAVAADGIVLVCTHTHTAPESGGITNLYRTTAFRQWAAQLAQKIGQSISWAASAVQPCSLAYGAAQAAGLGIHRRFKTTSGIMMSHPEPPQEVIISRDGATDDSVNVLCLRNSGGAPVAVVVNATCHPVYEMCIPDVSPDYPGELCAGLEQDHPGSVVLFLNGAAGNINPRGVSAGPEAAIRHAEALHAAVGRALATAAIDPAPVVGFRRSVCQLPTRLPRGEDCGEQLTASLAALRLGGAAVAFLPGEPFVETAMAIRARSPFEWTGVVGFTEETVGYIPTDEAFAEGGYETGFGPWSVLSPGSEPLLREASQSLLEEVWQVRTPAARFAPHVHGPAHRAAPAAAKPLSTGTTAGGGKRDEL